MAGNEGAIVLPKLSEVKAALGEYRQRMSTIPDPVVRHERMELATKALNAIREHAGDYVVVRNLAAAGETNLTREDMRAFARISDILEDAPTKDLELSKIAAALEAHTERDDIKIIGAQGQWSGREKLDTRRGTGIG